MMKRTFFYLPVVALLLSACNNGNAVNETPAGGTQTVPVSPGATDSATSLDQGDTGFSTTSADQAPSGENKVALNPPHGQPGHRCEIPVGAPLDGSAATNAAPAAPAPMINQSASPSGQAAPSNAKINPPHGQPGHDCAVPVGAPLPG